MRTTLIAAAALAMLGAPAIASSEAPVTGPARPIVAPVQIVTGSESAPMFGMMEVLVRGDSATVMATAAEASQRPRG
ncbi:hypothetical protein [Elioraea rosea]|uniref:hypothetical protein n=1 Tax=Elioraea rosea TaxID=2492390 RepID=UPI001186F77E|nr:hypothetical protein [Elioraea rosea]